MLIWVNGHSSVEGNKKADKMARRAVWLGNGLSKPEIATLAGIKQGSFTAGRNTYS